MWNSSSSSLFSVCCSLPPGPAKRNVVTKGSFRSSGSNERIYPKSAARAGMSSLLGSASETVGAPKTISATAWAKPRRVLLSLSANAAELLEWGIKSITYTLVPSSLTSLLSSTTLRCFAPLGLEPCPAVSVSDVTKRNPTRPMVTTGVEYVIFLEDLLSRSTLDVSR